MKDPRLKDVKIVYYSVSENFSFLDWGVFIVGAHLCLGTMFGWYPRCTHARTRTHTYIHTYIHTHTHTHTYRTRRRSTYICICSNTGGSIRDFEQP